jgi:hypothetical protein
MRVFPGESLDTAAGKYLVHAGEITEILFHRLILHNKRRYFKGWIIDYAQAGGVKSGRNA